MSPKTSFTTETLLELVETQRQWFIDVNIPLSKEHLDNIKRCSDIVGMDPNSIKRNTIKKRAVTITGYEADLTGTLKSSDCVPKLVTWWKTALHPNGLAAALSRHRELLPDQSLGNLSVISESH
ncbi:hypothetical protein M011DRAFT_472889 [Sporormia fimetaria CBS 119925]|uniref:Uncharacterized protein n=1 Tax=Sporormia fimetaria CBS 119925 TaxID=1340428 RepID=A0A6A6UW87_9PLEO|nr:hypothetical protein M011DRAFT_472889 [Sporormia fimetaria CBS 119925]